MPPDLRALVAPGSTAVVTQEMQNGVIGVDSPLRALRDAAQPIIGPAAAVCAAARHAGVPVVHYIAQRRTDGLGGNRNARLFEAAAALQMPIVAGTRGAEVVPELGPDPSDILLYRLHGLGPMGGTDLDPVLRNLGVTTIVGMGVSVNVAMTNFVMDAVNAGYQFVLPRDAVAGTPMDYADAVIDNTLSLLATITTAARIIDTWTRP